MRMGEGRTVCDQEMRNGSGKLLKTLMITLSLVTASICGPGNCPLIRIPCATIAATKSKPGSGSE